jgi:DNA-directed RNA polymerase specialized sigma24 family protein
MAAPVDRMDELVRLTVIQLRRQVPSQAEMILELNKVGFGPGRIAELLGTTPGTVGQEIQRAKKTAKKAPAKKAAAKKSV